MVSQVDALRVNQGRLPSQLTRDTTNLAAQIARSNEGQSRGAIGTVGSLISEIDRPLSERLGLKIPEMRGPLDEILNIGLQEATRPTNYLAALAGGPLATGVLRAGRGIKAAKVASSLLQPVSASRNPLTRIAAEATVAGAARGGSEAANELLPEDAPTWARVGVGLGAGLGSGVGAATAIGAAGRGAARARAGAPSLDVAAPQSAGAVRAGGPSLDVAAPQSAGADPRMGYDDIGRLGPPLDESTARYSAGKRSLLDAIDSEVAAGQIPEGAGAITKSALTMIPGKYLEDLTSSFSSASSESVMTLTGHKDLKGIYHRPLGDGLIPASIDIYRAAIQDDASATTIVHEVSHHLKTFLSKADNELLDAEFQLERLRFAPDDFGRRVLTPEEHLKSYRWTSFGEWFAEKLVDKTMDDVYRTASPELRSAIERGTATVRAWVTAVAEYLGATGRTDLMDDVYRKIKSGEYDVNTRSDPKLASVVSQRQRIDRPSTARIRDLDPAVIKRKANLFAGVEPSSYSTNPDTFSSTKVEELLGLERIKKGERGLTERVAEEGRFRADEPIVTPAMLARAGGKRAANSRVTVATNKVQSLMRNSGFTFSGKGRIPALRGKVAGVPGAPTLRDVAARLPEYAPYLNRRQLKALEGIRDLLAPYREALDEVAKMQSELTGRPSSLEIGSRPDVDPNGGFYIPRGGAEVEGLADVGIPPKRGGRSPRERRGSEDREAKFTSEAEGIDAGWSYVSVEDAIASLIRRRGSKILNQHTSNYLISQRDASGRRIATTAADRISPALVEEAKAIRGALSSARKTQIAQRARGFEAQAHSAKYDATELRLLNLEEAAAARLDKLPDAASANELTKEARQALRQSISTANSIIKNLERAKGRRKATGGEARRADRELDSLVSDLRKTVDEADAMTGKDGVMAWGGKQTDLPPEAKWAVKTSNREYERLFGASERVMASIGRLADRAVKKDSELSAAEGYVDELTELKKIADSDVRSSISELRAAGDVGSQIEVAKKELAILTRETDRSVKQAGSARGRAATARSKNVVTEDRISALRARLESFEKTYKAAKEQAAKPPRGEVGIAGLAGLEPYSFPAEWAAEVARTLKNEDLDENEFGAALKLANRTLRGVQATGELSYIGIQGAIGIAASPRAGLAMIKASLKALGNSGDEVLGDVFINFDQKAVARDRPTTETWAASGLHLGSSATEFQVGQGLPDAATRAMGAPVVKQLVAAPKSIVTRADRAFGVAGDTMRLELADTLAAEHMLRTGREMTRAELKTAAESANRVSGWTPQRAFGSWGEATQFAPRYLMSRVRALGQLASKDPLKRRMARRLVGRYLALGTTMTIASNELRGEETDYRPFSGKKGPTFDPRDAEYKNPNFMRVMGAGGRDWSLLGGMDSLLGLAIGVTSLGTNPVGDVEGITDRARALLSAPVVSAGLDWVLGENFEGEKLGLDTRAGQEDILQRLVPFAVPDLVESGQRAVRIGQGGDVSGAASEAAGGLVQGLIGGRGSQRTISEQVNTGDISHFTPDEQFRAISPETWLLVGQAQGLEAFDLSKYRHIGEWRAAEEENLLAQVRNQLNPDGTRKGEGQVQKEVQKYLNDMLPWKTYINFRNQLRESWIRRNPNEALARWNKDAELEWNDPLKWSPTVDQQDLIRSLTSTAQPAGVR